MYKKVKTINDIIMECHGRDDTIADRIVDQLGLKGFSEIASRRNLSSLGEAFLSKAVFHMVNSNYFDDFILILKILGRSDSVINHYNYHTSRFETDADYESELSDIDSRMSCLVSFSSGELMNISMPNRVGHLRRYVKCLMDHFSSDCILPQMSVRDIAVSLPVIRNGKGTNKEILGEDRDRESIFNYAETLKRDDVESVYRILLSFKSPMASQISIDQLTHSSGLPVFLKIDDISDYFDTDPIVIFKEDIVGSIGSNSKYNDIARYIVGAYRNEGRLEEFNFLSKPQARKLIKEEIISMDDLDHMQNVKRFFIKEKLSYDLGM